MTSRDGITPPPGTGAREAPAPDAAVTRILASLSGLVRKEIALIRAEAAEKAGQLRNGVILAVAAALLALVSLVALVDALKLALAYWAGWQPPVAAFAVTGGLALIAAVLGLMARARLDPDNLRPERTLRQLGIGRRDNDGERQ